MTFDGVTGKVAFDDTGHRKDFTLDVYNVAMNRGTAKVSWTDSSDTA